MKKPAGVVCALGLASSPRKFSRGRTSLCIRWVLPSPRGSSDPIDDEEAFLWGELARIESLKNEIDEQLGEVDEYDDFSDLFDSLPSDEEVKDALQDPEEREFADTSILQVNKKTAANLEKALLQGVVPASAGVGSNCLPGDWGFDPLELSGKDYIGRAQQFIVSLLPGETIGPKSDFAEERPSALVLRDYREAEIRHGRLAMLAAFFWPLQEMLDRLLLDDDQFGSLVGSVTNGGITLPYIPLLMTAIMLLLGYLDIYSGAIKDMDEIGEAFLPGDCFWDPLSVLDGAPDTMKRNMQERELFNGRMAMLAVAVYIWEEFVTHQPLISIEGNELLFEPAYQVPFIQKWLDSLFQTPSPVYTFPEVGSVDFVETLKEVIEEEEVLGRIGQQSP